MGKGCIGIDVGEISVKIGLFKIDGILVGKQEVKTHKEKQGKYVLEDMVASIEEQLTDKGIELSEIAGAGIGIPGPIMPDGYVEVCVNLGRRDKNPMKELRALLSVPVRVGSDANTAVLGEMWQGGGKGYTDIVMVTFGTGVGGGVIIDEKIIVRKYGLGGETGHIHIRDEETERYDCGDVSCVGQITSITGIAREARRKMTASDKPSALREFGEYVTARSVLDTVRTGNELVVDVMEAVGRYLGLVLPQLALTMDPKIFVIGGEAPKVGQSLIDVIDKHYDKYMVISRNCPIIGLATLDNDVGTYGVARLILD